MTKRLLAAVAVLAMLFALTACGDNKSATTDDKAAPKENTESNEKAENKEGTDTKGGEAKVLRVGVAAQHKPWCYQDENNKIVGIDPTILEEIARRNGWTVEYTVTNFEGMFGNLDTGKVDTCAQQLSATPVRAEKYLLSEVYAYNPYKLYVRTEENNINSVEDLKGRVFVCGPAGVEHEWITAYKKEHDPNDEIKLLITESETLSVNTGKGDAGGYPVVVFDEFIKETGYNLKMVGDMIYNENNIYPFNKNVDPEMFEAFNKTLKEMREDGFLKKVFMDTIGVDLSIDGTVKY